MTPEDVAQLKELAQYVVAPDGERIAYTTLSHPDVTSGEKDGRAAQQLKMAWGPELGREWLPAEMNVGAPHFSPDGRTVSFTWAEPNGKDAVWGMPVDGGGHRKLAEVAGVHVRDYRWAPDGSAIYMLAEPAPDDAANRLRDAGFDAIVFEEEHRFSRLMVARVGERVDKSPREIRVPGEVARFEITPNGKRAVLVSAPTPLVDDRYTASKLHVLDLASGTVGRTFDTGGKLGDFELAPDGRHVALIAAMDKHDPAATTLYLGNMETGALTPLNAGAAEAALDAEFMADGTLAVLIHKGAKSALRFYDTAGKAVSEIDTGDVIVRSIATAGKVLAARASTPRHPSELFRLEGDTLQRWTNHNPWLAAIDFGQQRTVTYTARDGQTIEGVLIEPVGGTRKGKPAPLIIDVHGGPESHETNGWSTSYSGPGQVAAGRGYAVFLPNYRGSTGYGTAFSMQHQRDYAGKEFNDLVDAKRALVSMGLADPARVGITGSSYGGYASAWGATALPDEFAAAVMFVGISNQISKVGTTEIPKEMHNVHARIWPWEDWQYMLDRSPIAHAGKAKTPLLILTGTDDTRVDPGQSHELYRAIKLRTDTPVRLVLYPREGHGNRKAAARYDYNLRMMEWFDRYLKGNGDRTRAAMPPPRPMAEPPKPRK